MSKNAELDGVYSHVKRFVTAIDFTFMLDF